MNRRDMVKFQKKLDRAIENTFEETYEFFKNTTPKRKGNARRNTKINEKHDGVVIEGNYPYAGKLDAGYSKQAPKGMTKPSLNKMRKVLKNELGKI